MKWRHPQESAGGLSTLLAVFTVMVVAYASLYPLVGWRWPPGQTPADALWGALGLPWPRWRDQADETLNLLGYVPVGFILTIAFVRRGWTLWLAPLWGLALASVLSYTLEILQYWLPMRVPSRRDWVGNTAGAASGALLATCVVLLGWIQAMKRAMDRWFVGDTAGALALLAIWPAGLLFPTPIPFALGHWWDELGHLFTGLVPTALLGLEGGPSGRRIGLSPLAEVWAVTAAVIGPMAMAAAISLPGRRRLALVAGVAAAGIGGMTLSSTLNFGPAHAMAWLTPAALAGVAVAMALGFVLMWPGQRLSAALCLASLIISVALVAQSQTDAYYAASLQAWEQGQFVRFHGLAQWIGWAWPYAAILWTLRRLSRPDGPPAGLRR